MNVAIVQARLGSTRFPGKIMQIVHGHMTALEFMIERVKMAKKVDKVIIATTTNPADQELIDLAINRGWDYYLGDENDVMGRVCNLIDEFKFTDANIVDLTSDCTLICPEMIDDMLDLFIEGEFDFYSNTITRSYYDGADIQIFKAKLLMEINKLVKDPEHRTHIGWNILNNLGELQVLHDCELIVGNETSEYFMPEIRIVLDYPEDLALIKKIISYFNRVDFTALDIMSLVRKYPHMMDINKMRIAKTPGVE